MPKIKNEVMNIENNLTFLDFFSGIGGFRKGLELCGMVCKGHCEIDKYADISYRAIHDVKEDEWYANDIKEVKSSELPRVNIWTAGFPCQDISVSGKQRGITGERSSLFFEIIRLLKGKSTEDKPEWLIFENVKNLLSINQGWDFATILNSLVEVGYNIEYGLLNSRFHGVPQNRERVYIVAYRHFRADSGRKVFPVSASDGKALIQLIGGSQGKRIYDSSGISCTLMANGGGFATQTGLYFIDLTKGKPKITEQARCLKARYDSGISNRSCDNSGVLCLPYACPNRIEKTALISLKKGVPELKKDDIFKCITAEYNKCGVNNRGEATGVFYGCSNALSKDNSLINKCNMSFCTKDNEYHNAIICGNLKCQYASPINYDSYIKSSNKRKIQSTNDTEKEKNILSYCGRVRKLTPRECWRLQGFPDEMIDKAMEVNSDSQLYKQAGNSVTVSVVYAVGSRIVDIENNLKTERKMR